MEVEPPLVRARQRQQAVDEIGHARHFLHRLLECLHALVTAGVGMHGALDVGADDSQRRLELVTGVGGKAPQSGERGLQAADHAIERLREPRELFVRLVGGQPAVQASPVGDGLYFINKLVDRLERVACEDIGDAHRHEQKKRRNQQQRAEQQLRRHLGFDGRHSRDDLRDVRHADGIGTRDDEHASAEHRVARERHDRGTAAGFQIDADRLQVVLVAGGQLPHGER